MVIWSRINPYDTFNVVNFKIRIVVAAAADPISSRTIQEKDFEALIPSV